jgi:nitrite reductase/ring-hydroxylating ferredoxin subunit
VRVCSLTDLPEEGALKVHLDGRDICVARSQG